MPGALDEQLPRWHFRERHATAVGAPAEAVLAALQALSWREVPVFRALMAVRLLGRPWSPRGGMRTVASADSFRDFDEPGWAKLRAAGRTLSEGDRGR